MSRTMTLTELAAEIKSLTEFVALIGTDEGTHGKPGTYRIYAAVTGGEYATYSFAGANASRCTVAEAEEGTAGRIRWFAASRKEVAAKRKELESLRKELAARTKGLRQVGVGKGEFAWYTVPTAFDRGTRVE